MAFEAITTQEQFDTAISDRLKRERDTIEKRYEGYLSPEDVEKRYEGYLSPDDVQEKYKDYLSPDKAAEKDAMIANYEKKSKKVQIAMAEGIPFDLADKISGDTEEDMQKDAKRMAGFIKKTNTYPEYNPEPTNKDSKKEAMKKMLTQLKGE